MLTGKQVEEYKNIIDNITDIEVLKKVIHEILNLTGEEKSCVTTNSTPQEK